MVMERGAGLPAVCSRASDQAMPQSLEIRAPSGASRRIKVVSSTRMTTPRSKPTKSERSAWEEEVSTAAGRSEGRDREPDGR